MTRELCPGCNYPTDPSAYVEGEAHHAPSCDRAPWNRGADVSSSPRTVEEDKTAKHEKRRKGFGFDTSEEGK